MALCKTCGAVIDWVTMKETGKKMPLDPKPLDVIVKIDGVFGRMAKGYISHFATCPNAKEHRKKD
jgi:hypothetical protein